MAKTGDTVRFLNSTGGGRIVRIEGNMAYVEDSDGFEVPALLRECVVVMTAEDAPKPKEAKVEFGKKLPSQQAKAPSKETVAAQQREPQPEELPVEETPEGEKLNIVAAVMADNIRTLSETAYTMELVNDSNYYLSFALMARAEDEKQWRLIKSSTVEPNIVLTLCKLESADIQLMDRICLQYTAFKADKPFAMKLPESVELKVDTTKFYKFHCYKENVYFDEPVIAFEFVRDDRPNRQITVDAGKLREAMAQKKQAERQTARPVRKRLPKTPDVLEVDLHIGELTDTVKGLSNADILNLQIDTFRRVMDENLKNHGCKIVFIHGKGEGVLRNALLKELNHRYKGHDVQDASFREYGFGATQVTIR